MAVLRVLLTNFIHVPGIVIAFTLHEYVKAAASTAMGDATPKNYGRLTLNPAKHIDPAGFLFLVFFGLGWGKPVETRAFGYKDRKKAELAIYILPTVANIFMAAALAIAAWLMSVNIRGVDTALNSVPSVLYSVLAGGATMNLCYALFNLLPVYPLDCARVVAAVNPKAGMWLKHNERLLQLALLLLVTFGFMYQLIGGVANGLLAFMYV